MTIQKINRSGRKQSYKEIDKNRYNQILGAMEYLQTNRNVEIVKTTDETKTVIVLKDQSSDLLTLEVHDYRDSARYYYTEAA